MKLRLASLLLGAVLGCGGGADAKGPDAPLASTSTIQVPLATEPVNPRVIPKEETALEACLAPIDPIVFSKLGGEPRAKHKSVAPRRPRPQMLDSADPCETMGSTVECAYREARTHFEQRRFDLAAKGFRKIALETEVTDEGLFAGQLALEAMNILGTHAEPPRTICFEVMASDNDKLIDRYCQKPLRSDREDSCATFFQIARDLRRLRAETLVKTADSGGPDDPKRLYEQAGDEYRALFDEACTAKPQAGARCDELLFNAHRSYRAAGARTKMEAAHRAFFDPRFGLEKSPLAERLGKPED